MTLRWLLLTDIRRVAIGALARFLKLREFIFDAFDVLTIGICLAVFVALSACRNRHIGSQSAQRAHPGDIYMTARALGEVMIFTAFMIKLHGFSRWPCGGNKSSLRRLVTTAAVIARRLLILPVTIEAGIMCLRHCLESSGGRDKRINPASRRRAGRARVRRMTERTVVVIDFLPVVGSQKRRGSKTHSCCRRAQGGDYILMFVMRKLDLELTFVPGLGRLLRVVRFTKSKPRVCARRRAQMADSANRRTGAGKRLARKKLLPMTTNTGLMIGKIRDVRKVSLCRPGCWHFVTAITSQAFVLVRGMQKGRVLCG
jgi:hypothetical protein